MITTNNTFFLDKASNNKHKSTPINHTHENVNIFDRKKTYVIKNKFKKRYTSKIQDKIIILLDKDFSNFKISFKGIKFTYGMGYYPINKKLPISTNNLRECLYSNVIISKVKHYTHTEIFKIKFQNSKCVFYLLKNNLYESFFYIVLESLQNNPFSYPEINILYYVNKNINNYYFIEKINIINI